MFELVSKVYRWFMSLKREIRYVLVGGGNTAIGFGIFTGMQLSFGDIWVASTCLYVASFFSMMISFFTMKYFVFQSKGKILKEYMKNMTVQLLALGINGILLDWAVASFPFHPIGIQAVLMIFMAGLTYLGHRFFSFR